MSTCGAIQSETKPSHHSLDFFHIKQTHVAGPGFFIEIIIQTTKEGVFCVIKRNKRKKERKKVEINSLRISFDLGRIIKVIKRCKRFYVFNLGSQLLMVNEA